MYIGTASINIDHRKRSNLDAPNSSGHISILGLDHLAAQASMAEHVSATQSAVSDEYTNGESSHNPDEALQRRGSINTARRRPSHVPRVSSESYPAFREKQKTAMRICLEDLKAQLHKATAVLGVEFCEHGKGVKLTFGPDRQSKLSQQELQDLQKATHFDKKELQQWYKGMRLVGPATVSDNINADPKPPA